jgi:hypothetical protein
MHFQGRLPQFGLIFGLALAPASAFALDYQIERIASGLNQPTYVTQAPGDPPNILYYTTRTLNAVSGFTAANQMGGVYRYDTNTRTSTLVLDLSSRSVTQDTGLSTIAFSPDYNSPGTPGFHKMFVASAQAVTLGPTSGGPINRVEEYSVGTTGPATFGTTVLQYANTGNAFNNHTLDWIGFDPTATGTARNNLYISEGDGNFSLPNRPAQNPNDLEGKVLRVDISGASANVTGAGTIRNFSIPASNPIPAYNAAHPSTPISGLGEVYVTGLRNPDRVSFDHSTGDLYIGDVGESSEEEVDFVKAGLNTGGGITGSTTGGPVDYGWPEFEGTAASTGNVSPTHGVPTNPFTGVTSLKPIQQYAHAGGAARAVIGGYDYRGPIASLQGIYFFSDYVSGTISALAFDRNDPTAFNGNNGTLTNVTALWNSTSSPIIFDPTNPNYTFANVGSTWGISHIVSYGEDTAGNVYIVDFGGVAGDPNFNGQYPGAGQGEIFELVPLPEPAAILIFAMAGLLPGRNRRLSLAKLTRDRI